ncbi:antitoxin VbhA family protein [Brevibacterium sp. 50QC2O2]|uniref:antitoxin VbhA family protein n=1 Tax=Brevibacterium sp. 50QC2O2 TaxID=2968459 RepID=UPI00211C8C2F|nr:antitoxin VbhA family protein [Brevibacterium sp. 50QC2O2]MCQ9388515.1 antitoxin VbhA family protein [Brevibacterium sp. 50QC2O2]
MQIDNDPVEQRREAMIDILASWDLDGAVPDEVGMSVVRDYVAGRLSLPEAIERMKDLPLPRGSRIVAEPRTDPS